MCKAPVGAPILVGIVMSHLLHLELNFMLLYLNVKVCLSSCELKEMVSP